MNFLNSDKRLLVTNPHAGSPGAAVLKIEYPELKATVEEMIEIPKQQASCWVAYSPRFSKYAYVMDALASNVTIVDPRVGRVETEGVVQFQTRTPGAGALDARVDRRWLYALTDDTADSRLNVWEIEKQGWALKQVQGFDITGELGLLPYRMGLAIWSAEY